MNGLGFVVKFELQCSDQIFTNISVVATVERPKYHFATQGKSLLFRMFKNRVRNRVEKIIEAVTEKLLMELTLDLGTILGFMVNNFLTEPRMTCLHAVIESLLDMLETSNCR